MPPGEKHVPFLGPILGGWNQQLIYGNFEGFPSFFCWVLITDHSCSDIILLTTSSMDRTPQHAGSVAWLWRKWQLDIQSSVWGGHRRGSRRVTSNVRRNRKRPIAIRNGSLLYRRSSSASSSWQTMPTSSSSRLPDGSQLIKEMESDWKLVSNALQALVAGHLGGRQ